VDARKIRPPAVAGRFYPADPRKLEAEVSHRLRDAPAAAGPVPKALIAPHAGYVFSGDVAAAAFATLRRAADIVTRVVVIGPAHFVPVRGIAAATSTAFATPLGEVPLDAGALAELVGSGLVTANDAAHAPEHSIEVELPFLQRLLPRFTLIPLLVGISRPEEVAQVLGRLWGGDETLIVVSSDLSHYHPYEAARRRDLLTAERIELADGDGLRPDDACGYLPIAGLLAQTTRHGLSVRRLALCNSGDTAGPKDAVVGYGAWTFA
jgi:AmmeMemoRadiSam system protein B